MKPTFPFRIDFPPELPISARATEIIETLRQNQVVILAGETGSGKTTQIPKMCLAAGGGREGRIACTQPRRVAALSVSRRVAEELGVNWGREVGCKVRFDDHTSNATIVKFLTDGMLLAEIQSDPQLRDYDTIIVDEAHERSLNIDFLLGHLRQLRHQRPELQIVITSATIDTAAFSKAFDDAPIIEVSGRTYPVEVIYEPLDGLGSDAEAGDEPAAKAEALHYIEGAVMAVERILKASDSGDILVFMPAERDIRETRELLEGRRLPGCEIVTLFGRLSNSEQQRVFAPSQRRKIIIATNIAETSLTIPGIHYVVDTGLARISRYAAQARTRRLPIEEIAQSSADQRKGRCGRVADGVCIRLYSEQDYNARPRFTQPEIQRANLADVILRMKAFGLGDIERFPFINMPASKAIRAGYALLEELGAIEVAESSKTASPQESATGAEATSRFTHTLTPLGRELARLPVDPTVGRMILQAREEKCLREVLIIASGLSIQDPRERPMEAREKADAAHRKFNHPDSDFLALLKIWEAFHDELETLSQSKLRRFCRDHFLSYTRLREWRDIHAQLVDTLGEREEFRATSVFDGMSEKKREEPINTLLGWTTPAYRSIHRAILAGLLSNIAVRDEETGQYKATHDRRVNLFPGSALFNRNDGGGREKSRGGEGKSDNKPARWLMAAEIMETSRLYARTCARLDPTWALDLAAHLVRVSYSDPFWQVDGGRVLVKRRTRLYGLELESRAVGFGRVDPRAATEIFIREGLVNDTITWPFGFLSHNRAVRERIENLLTRARHSSYMNLDEAIFRFYAKRLIDDQGEDEGFEPISAVAELTALVREREKTEPNFLRMREEDLRDPEELLQDTAAFPETLPIENRALPLNYAYKPGQADDGVTLEVNVRDAAALTPAALDWAVPGHLEPKVEHYLRATPKELRKAFVPITETARQLTSDLRSQAAARSVQTTLLDALAAAVEARHRIHIDPTYWLSKPLPDHLRVRVRLVDDQGREVAAARDLATVQEGLHAHTRELSQTASREDPA
ncbi:MAG TPA: ATP-dependent RNA helicase HrpA, partial [Opitutaceae bacterium]